MFGLWVRRPVEGVRGVGSRRWCRLCPWRGWRRAKTCEYRRVCQLPVIPSVGLIRVVFSSDMLYGTSGFHRRDKGPRKRVMDCSRNDTLLHFL